MTLDEAIEHAIAPHQTGKCAEDHTQLAEWLRELKQIRLEKVELKDRAELAEAEVKRLRPLAGEFEPHIEAAINELYVLRNRALREEDGALDAFLAKAEELRGQGDPPEIVWAVVYPEVRQVKRRLNIIEPPALLLYEKSEV